MIIVIVLLNLESIKSSPEDACVKIDGEETCHTTDSEPYRLYGTKTAYHIATENYGSSTDLDIGGKLLLFICFHDTYSNKGNE